MVDNNRELETIIDSVATTMRKVKGSLTNRALLANITNLAPILHNKTRW
jgi:hypothetical protein